MDAATQAAMAKLDEALALLGSAAGPPHPAADKVVAALRTLRDAERAARLPPAPRPAPPPAQRGTSLRSRPGKDSGTALSHAATLPASFLARQARLAGAPVDGDAGGGRPSSDSAESGTDNSSGGGGGGGGGSAAADKLAAASAAAEAGWRKMLGGGGAKAPAAKPALSKGALAKVAADAAAAGMGKCEGPHSPPTC